MAEIFTPETIIDQYGLNYNPRFSCVSNAVVNGIKIHLSQIETSLFPEMYIHVMPLGTHAYLVWQNVALNGGVTAERGAFRDFSVEALRSVAEDRTKFWLKYTLEAFFNDIYSSGDFIPYDHKNDFAQNRRHMEMVFTGDKLVKAVECLKRGIIATYAGKNDLRRTGPLPDLL